MLVRIGGWRCLPGATTTTSAGRGTNAVVSWMRNAAKARIEHVNSSRIFAVRREKVTMSNNLAVVSVCGAVRVALARGEQEKIAKHQIASTVDRRFGSSELV